MGNGLEEEWQSCEVMFLGTGAWKSQPPIFVSDSLKVKACARAHTRACARPSPTPYPMSWFSPICSSDSYNVTCRALFCRCLMKKWNWRGGRKGRKEGREGMRWKERKYFLNSLGNSSLNRIFFKVSLLQDFSEPLFKVLQISNVSPEYLRL